MSLTPIDCCNPCVATPPVNIPGTAGAPGAPGAGGAAGINAFTVLTANLTLPGAPGNPATMIVANSAWAVIGENIVVGDGTNFGTFKVTALPAGGTSITGTWLGYPQDSVAGTTINAGATVSPGGTLPAVPVTIADGGTGAITKATAQVALGLGQNITEKDGTALAYAITNAAATITSMTVTAPATGLYLVVGWAAVAYRGVTFASSRTLTLKIRNTTAGADLSTALKTTGAPTTTDYPTLDYQMPYVTANLTAADVIALQIGLSVVASAGTSTVEEASLALIPLALA